MAKMGKKPSELLSYLYSKVGQYHYDRRDYRFESSAKANIIRLLEQSRPAYLAGSAVTKTDTIDGFRFFLKDGDWLLIRFSGTEPLLRIYAESRTPERVEELLREGTKLTGAG